MGEPRIYGDFQLLRQKNVERCNSGVFTQAWGDEHNLQEWTPLEWAGAMGGEAGEAANVAKKIRRLGRVVEEIERNPTKRAALAPLVRALGKEVADVVIYADLLLARVGLSLAVEVIEKFNEVSERVGSPVRMPPVAMEEGEI